MVLSGGPKARSAVRKVNCNKKDTYDEWKYLNSDYTKCRLDAAAAV